MTSAYDPARLRAERFTRLGEQRLTSVGSGSGGWSALREIVRHRQMLDLLIRRDLKSRFKDSSLGFLWTLIRPLTQLAIYYVVMGQFLGAARGIPDFAIYVFAGLTIYGLFAETVIGGVNSIVGNSGLVKKIYLPREVFPLAAAGSAAFTFTIQLGVLLVATIAFGVAPWHLDLLYAIPSILLILIYATALALLLAAVNVYLRDTQYIAEVVMMFLMWASPIVYGWTMVKDVFGGGLVMEIYTNNPITLAVLGFHRAFWTSGDASQYPDMLLVRMLVAGLVGVVLLIVCHGVFRRLQGNFAQEL